MAHPNMTGNQKGYMSKKILPTKVGLAQADFFSARFNERSDDTATPIQQSEIIARRQHKKLPSLGGAIAAFVSIDEYARYVIGTFVKFYHNR
jgi:hypothetical protein